MCVEELVRSKVFLFFSLLSSLFFPPRLRNGGAQTLSLQNRESVCSLNCLHNEPVSTGREGGREGGRKGGREGGRGGREGGGRDG